MKTTIAQFAIGGLALLPIVSFAQTAAEDQIRPGYWATTTTMERIEFLDLPPEQSAAIAAEMGLSQDVNHYCVTEEDAAMPLESMFDQTGDLQCAFAEAVIEAGTVRIRGECTDAAQTMPLFIAMEGTYTSATMDMAMEGTASIGPDVGPMQMYGRVEARYIGACPPPGEEAK